VAFAYELVFCRKYKQNIYFCRYISMRKDYFIQLYITSKLYLTDVGTAPWIILREEEKHKTSYDFKATLLHHRPVSYIVTDSVHTSNRARFEKHCQNVPAIRSGLCLCERFTDYCAILKIFDFTVVWFFFSSWTIEVITVCVGSFAVSGKSEAWWNRYTYYLTLFKWKR